MKKQVEKNNKLTNSEGFNLTKFIKKQELFVLGLLFIFLAFAFIIPNFWGIMPLNYSPFTSMYLEEFDKDVYLNEQFCFDLVLDIQGQPVFRNNLVIFANDSVLDFQKVFFSDENYYSRVVNYNYCFDENVLSNGNNTIKAMLGTEKVFFNIEKKQGIRKETTFLMDFKDVNNEGVSFSLLLENFDKFEPISIFVNGELDHKVYPVEGRNNFIEKLSFDEGNNLITLQFRDKEISKEYFHTAPVTINPFLGLILFLIGFFVFVGFVFSEEDYIRKFALSFTSLFVLLIAISFALNVLNFLSLVSFFALYIVSILIIAFVFRHNFKLTELNLSFLSHLKNPLLFLIIFAAIALPLVFNVFTVSNYSYWNVYYERQSASLAENFSLPLEDEISYFGRPLAFIPGYFFFDASISWLFGLDGAILFGLLLCLANLFFLITLFSFCKAFNFSMNKAALFYIFMWMENFVRGALFVSPRHAFSLGLFLIAMMLLLEYRKKILAGLTIAFCGFVQTPLLVAFPILYLIIAKKIKWKELIFVMAIAVVTFLILYLPNFLNFGMLSQADKGAWGYLINYDLLNIFLDLGPLLVFFVLFILPDILRKDFKWTSYRIKLLVFAIIGLLFQLFVSYRWNIFNTINIALFLVIALPEKVVSQKYFLRLFAILILLIGLVMSAGINLSQITNYQTTALDFINENSSTNDRLLNDPLFGHSLAFFTQRPIMSDLAVEYAPQSQLDETYNFLEDSNYEVLKKYDIKWTYSQSLVVNTQAFGSKVLDDFLEFEKIDKVFTNSFFYVHWVGNNLDE